MEPVQITERAAQEIKIIQQSDAIPDDTFLRIGIQEGGGCGSTRFTIGFDTKRETDLSYQNYGVTILVDKKHVVFVMGITVSYKENDNEWGFVFHKD